MVFSCSSRDHLLPDVLRPALSQGAQRQTVEPIGAHRSARLVRRQGDAPHRSNSENQLPYFTMGSTTGLFSLSNTSPSLPSMRYWIFNCFTVPGAGSPPKASLYEEPGKKMIR